jgi:TetR/AcrR family transcriptional repressor of bet genes
MGQRGREGIGVSETDLAEKGPRKQSRAARRLQLIEATLETLAARGYARVTLQEVARGAGLSHGLVNFHFASKEALLEATLGHLAEEYRANWQARLAEAGADPAAQLAALIAADFDPAVHTPLRLGAWCAFLGEAQARPLYQARCQSNDDHYIAEIERLVAALCAERGIAQDPTRIARALRLAILGAWLDIVTLTAPYPMAEAHATVLATAQAFFPGVAAFEKV